MSIISTVDGLLIASNESAVVLGSTISLEAPESLSSYFTIVVVFHGCTLVVADKQIFLIVARSEQSEHARVSSITDGLQDHEFALLDGDKTNIFHGLHERKSATVGFAGLVVEVHVEGVLVVQVVASPELHGHGPSNQVFRITTPDEGAVREQTGPALLVEMPVAEHGRVRVEIANATGGTASGRLDSRCTEDPNSLFMKCTYFPSRDIFLYNYLLFIISC